MKKIKYQQKAVAELVEKTIELLNLNGNRRKLVFKAPTGSGKTVMASELLQILAEELPNRSDTKINKVAFIWIAPNKLHQQSYFKMKNFFTETRTLRPVMFDELDHADGYIKPGEILFVNWESINKDNAVMIRDNEQNRCLYSITERTQNEEHIPIICVIDEEHFFGGNNAVKSEKVLCNIKPKVEIRISATPITQGDAMVSIPREMVIAEEMIKEGILLNPAIRKGFTDERTLNEHLIRTALQKREEMAKAYRDLGVNINPLLLIQLPNDKKEDLSAEETLLVEQIKTYLDAIHSINTDNGKMAVWLSKEKQNLEHIEDNGNMTEVLLFKQAIALGWDCPRAAVLLIFRKLESFTFTIQTIGRILRMPEQRFYPNELLNKGYVYTDLSADKIEIVKDDMDYISTIWAHRKEGIQNVSLPSVYSEYKSDQRNRLGSDFRKVLQEVLVEKWRLKSIQYKLNFDGEDDDDFEMDATIAEKNRTAAANNMSIKFDVRSISVEIPEDVKIEDELGITEISGQKAKFAKRGDEIDRIYKEFCRSLLGRFEKVQGTSVLSNALLGVMENLFEIIDYEAEKVVLYHENKPKFEDVIKTAINRYEQILIVRQKKARERGFRQYTWEVPEERIYNEATNEVVDGIDAHALEPFIRLKQCTTPESNFEQYLEDNKQYIEWWYKNGDEGKQHYAIEYTASGDAQALFYVDFVVRMKNGKIFLFDTKSCGSDTEAPNKHNALIEYIKQHSTKEQPLGGGIIIEDGLNWKYCPMKIENTTDLMGWDCFYPEQYQ